MKYGGLGGCLKRHSHFMFFSGLGHLEHFHFCGEPALVYLQVAIRFWLAMELVLRARAT